MRRIVNMFGAVGYSLLIFSYAVTLGVLAMWMIQGGYLESIGISPADDAVVQIEGQDEVSLNFFQQFLKYTLSIGAALITLFILVTLPYWLGRGGSRVLKRIIRFCQYPVTLGTLLAAKILASSLCAALIVICGFLKIDIVVILVLLSVVVLALLVFLTQHHLARTSEVVEPKNVW